MPRNSMKNIDYELFRHCLKQHTEINCLNLAKLEKVIDSVKGDYLSRIINGKIGITVKRYWLIVNYFGGEEKFYNPKSFIEQIKLLEYIKIKHFDLLMAVQPFLIEEDKYESKKI